MRCDVAAVRMLLVAAGVLAARPVAAQTLGATSRPATPGAYEALLDGMSCRQHKSGRMDCEFRVANAVRFVIAGVGQEDVTITVVQADSNAAFVASVVPLHGCIAVKPTPAAAIAAGDSVTTFAFVSPRTGKVYRTWQTCLSATRGESIRAGAGDAAKSRAARDSIVSTQTRVIVAKVDSIRRADSVKRAARVRPLR